MFDYSHIKLHPHPGKYVSIDGLGGVGKGTQLDQLVTELKKRRYEVHQTKMPDYDLPSGQALKRYTNNEFGPANAIHAFMAAMPYVLNRTVFNKGMAKMLGSNDSVLVCDRGPLSNFAYQGAKLPEHERHEFYNWLAQLEYEEFGTFRENLCIFLIASQEVYQQQAERRVVETGDSSAGLDGHESDQESIAKIESIFLELANYLPWCAAIKCLDTNGKMRSVSSIHQEVLTLLEDHLAP